MKKPENQMKPNKQVNKPQLTKQKTLQNHWVSPKQWEGMELTSVYCDPRPMVLLDIQVGEIEIEAAKWKYLSDSKSQHLLLSALTQKDTESQERHRL